MDMGTKSDGGMGASSTEPSSETEEHRHPDATNVEVHQEVQKPFAYWVSGSKYHIDPNDRTSRKCAMSSSGLLRTGTTSASIDCPGTFALFRGGKKCEKTITSVLSRFR